LNGTLVLSANPPIRPQVKSRRRKTVIIILAIAIFLLFFIVSSQQAFNLTFMRPTTSEQTLIFSALSALIFLLLVALTFVLLRTLLKLFAETRGGVLGSKFRTKMVVGALVLSFAPVLFLFLFAYGLMNRSIDKWFSRPVEEVRQDTARVGTLLSNYAFDNAKAEATSISEAPPTQRGFATGNFAPVIEVFRHHEAPLQGGFAVAIVDGEAEAAYHLPQPWPMVRERIGEHQGTLLPLPKSCMLNGVEYILGAAMVGGRGGWIMVGMPLPAEFSSTMAQIEASQQRYMELAQQRKLVRRTYMGLLLLLTVLVLFAATWLALFMSKFVTRPVAALAEATEQISRGKFDYRVSVNTGDELGKLVQSFNRMAEELESSRRQIEASSHELADANIALEQRRRHMETILESIPTGVLSLDAERRITHTNSALNRILWPEGNGSHHGVRIDHVFSPEVMQELRHLLRKADRMGSTTSQMDIPFQRHALSVAVTAASLQHEGQRLGWVLVFEDLSDLLKAQKQAAWREVARRVAHEIKNPLTPIALSAERIRRHLERGTPPDQQSLEIINSCAQTIGGAVETVRTLVDEFSTFARFPASQPQPADVNAIVESALAMFNGRLDGVRIQTQLAPDLPRVMADPEAIKRAIANLVDNAAEAMRESMVREVDISTALIGARDAVEIVISDTGHGVTRELKEKLFMPYFSTKQRGTGLGLAIVSRIVEDHRGTIRVEENKPAGARFIVELPVAAEPAQTAHA
jgi:two-component system, NtrC family, nitrogen regulation sensor histidine kinase NtrY